jgi:hypothetical protein
MAIRRNKNGQQNLNDLRKKLKDKDGVFIYRYNCRWVIRTVNDAFWRDETCPHKWTERQAIQSELFGEAESPAEVKYHAERAI